VRDQDLIYCSQVGNTNGSESSHGGPGNQQDTSKEGAEQEAGCSQDVMAASDREVKTTNDNKSIPFVLTKASDSEILADLGRH
jgi:hypothetical protein